MTECTKQTCKATCVDAECLLTCSVAEAVSLCIQAERMLSVGNAPASYVACM